MKRIWLNTAEVPMLMRQIISSEEYDENFEKRGNLLTISLQNRDKWQSDKSEKSNSFIAEQKIVNRKPKTEL